MGFLRYKWTQLFKCLDVNRDGVLSKQDYRSCLTEFESYYRSQEREKSLADMREGVRSYWEDFIFTKIAHKDSISCDEFVTSMTEEFQTDRDGLRDLSFRTISAICKAADADNDGYLSYDEVTALFRAFGTNDENLVQKFYQEYQPGEKGVELAKYIDSWVDLVLGEDKEKENIPLKEFLSKI